MLFQNYNEFGASVSKLQVANNLPVVSQSQCLRKLPNITKDGTQFCAGEKGKDSFVKLHISKTSQNMQ